ncbi:MAG TPA: c-type cytochrome [Burkholderiaceae bacterium]|nr:c-type cytochrome [Burkholderiaceae bacterium]
MLIRIAVPALALTLANAALAQSDAGRKLATEVCAPCHGADGNSSNPEFPILAGQTARYLYLELRDFKAGRRTDPVMSPVAATLSTDDMHAVADYFAGQKMASIVFNGTPDRVARGEAKSTETLCTMCHLGNFVGQNEIPRVGGQYPAYIAKQLRAFKAHTRTNDAGNMTAVARTLSDEDIVDLSEYIAGLR